MIGRIELATASDLPQQSGALTFTLTNHCDGSMATVAPAFDIAAAHAVADNAAAAAEAWGVLGPNARRALLMKAADALEAKAGPFIDAMMREVGATEGWARFNLVLAASMLRERRR